LKCWFWWEEALGSTFEVCFKWVALVVRDGVVEGFIHECNFVLDLKNTEKMDFNAWLLNDDKCVNNNYYCHKSFTRGMVWPFSTLLLYESIMVSFLGAMLGCSSLFHPSFKNSILKLIHWMEMDFANLLKRKKWMPNIINIYGNSIKVMIYRYHGSSPISLKESK